MDADGTVVGIEVKSTETVRGEDFRGLRHLMNRLGDRFRTGLVLYAGEQQLSFGDRPLPVLRDLLVGKECWTTETVLAELKRGVPFRRLRHLENRLGGRNLRRSGPLPGLGGPAASRYRAIARLCIAFRVWHPDLACPGGGLGCRFAEQADDDSHALRRRARPWCVAVGEHDADGRAWP